MEAEHFFSEYHKIFDSGNMKKFSRLFHEPFVSVRADGKIVSMPTNESVEIFFNETLIAWKKDGYRYFSPKNYETTTIGTKSKLVTLTWELLDGNKQIIREWRQSYNLLEGKSGWKVLCSTYHS